MDTFDELRDDLRHVVIYLLMVGVTLIPLALGFGAFLTYHGYFYDHLMTLYFIGIGAGIYCLCIKIIAKKITKKIIGENEFIELMRRLEEWPPL